MASDVVDDDTLYDPSITTARTGRTGRRTRQRPPSGGRGGLVRRQRVLRCDGTRTDVFNRIVVFEAFPTSDGLDPELIELVRLKVADTRQCAYCATVRTEEVRDDVAPKERAIFGDEIDPEALTDGEYLAVRLRRTTLGGPSPTDGYGLRGPPRSLHRA